jgi:hypothetical protein
MKSPLDDASRLGRFPIQLYDLAAFQGGKWHAIAQQNANRGNCGDTGTGSENPDKI